jgi:[ribosomal protein S5]-alanine N-acetyltransferase
MIVAETDRLILRHYTRDDAEAFFEIYSDPETMRFMGKGPPSVEDERAAIERHIKNYYERLGFGLFVVVLKATDQVIGRCGIITQKIDGVEMEEISYLIDRPLWGNGYAAEAANAVVCLAAERFGLSRLIALILPANVGSVRVAEKCGFTLERTVDNFKIWNNVGVFSMNLSRNG